MNGYGLSALWIRIFNFWAHNSHYWDAGNSTFVNTTPAHKQFKDLLYDCI